MRKSSPPWSGSPRPSNSTESPSEAVTFSTAALNRSGELTANGIVSCTIQSPSLAYSGACSVSPWSPPPGFPCHQTPLPEPVAIPLDPAVHGQPLRHHAEAMAPLLIDVQLDR